MEAWHTYCKNVFLKTTKKGSPSATGTGLEQSCPDLPWANGLGNQIYFRKEDKKFICAPNRCQTIPHRIAEYSTSLSVSASGVALSPPQDVPSTAWWIPAPPSKFVKSFLRDCPSFYALDPRWTPCSTPNAGCFLPPCDFFCTSHNQLRICMPIAHYVIALLLRHLSALFIPALLAHLHHCRQSLPVPRLTHVT